MEFIGSLLLAWHGFLPERSPPLPVFRQAFLTKDYLGIVMEFVGGGDMFEYVVKKNGLREEEARWFFQQLIVGLDHCHRMVGDKQEGRGMGGAGFGGCGSWSSCALGRRVACCCRQP